MDDKTDMATIISVSRLDKLLPILDGCIEEQMLRPGADDLRAVAVVNRYNDVAGSIERDAALGLDVDVTPLIELIRHHRTVCDEAARMR